MFDKAVITGISIVKNVSLTAGYKSYVHERPSFGISICKSGKNIYYQDGHTYVSDPAHVILFPSGSRYMLECVESGTFPLVNFDCLPDVNQTELCSLQIRDAESCLRDHEALERAVLFGQGNNHAECMSLLYRLLTRLSDNDTHAVPPLLGPAIRYMEQHFDDPLLSNEVLAHAAGISEVYFRRLFKESYGVSPGRYLQRVRIEKARALLESTNDSITQIAAASGYSSVYCFCRAFRQQTGSTPGAYRRNNAQLYL